MKEKKDNCEENIKKLRELIKTWKINMAMLAEKMGMNHSTLKLKLSENQPQYYLTEEEYRILLRYLFLMANDIKRLYIKGIRQTSDKLSFSKK